MKNTKNHRKVGYSNLVTTELIGPCHIIINVSYSNDLTMNLSVPQQTKSNKIIEGRHSEDNRIKMVIDKRWKSHKEKSLGHLLLPLSYEGKNICDLEIYYPRTIDPDISIRGPHKLDDRSIISKNKQDTNKENFLDHKIRKGLSHLIKIIITVYILIVTVLAVKYY